MTPARHSLRSRLDPFAIFAMGLASALASCDSMSPNSRAAPPPAPLAVSGAPSPARTGEPSAPAGSFKAPREARTASYEVTWSVSPKAQGSERVLELEYAVKALEELYISDRLWDGDVVHTRTPDPYGVYRFVQNGSLRLVFAQAPHPPNVHLGNLYRPLYARIRAGETRRQKVSIKLPVAEYSALERDVDANAVLEEVSRVFLVIDYRLRKTMDKEPEPPSRESAESAGYVVVAPEHIILELPVDKIPVKRRTGYIARFPLPGEPGPGPMPLP